jgi:16S rRNA (uracil1498-N3)-methyltransferase
MQRFFVPPAILEGEEVRIGGETSRQISRVLRMQPGDQVCLLDGTGSEYIVTLTAFSRDEITGEVIEKKPGSSEPGVKITLYLSLLNKADKFEWALQKCTELGAAGFVAVQAARCIADTPSPAKIDRWQRIIQEAAEQSGRSLLPSLTTTATLAQVLKQETINRKNSPQDEHLALMPTPGAGLSMATALQNQDHRSREMSIIIGPEGGFTGDEVEASEDAGVDIVTLGPRTLRAETAAVASLTMALYEMGEMR